MRRVVPPSKSLVDSFNTFGPLSCTSPVIRFLLGREQPTSSYGVVLYLKILATLVHQTRLLHDARPTRHDFLYGRSRSRNLSSFPPQCGRRLSANSGFPLTIPQCSCFSRTMDKPGAPAFLTRPGSVRERLEEDPRGGRHPEWQAGPESRAKVLPEVRGGQDERANWRQRLSCHHGREKNVWAEPTGVYRDASGTRKFARFGPCSGWNMCWRPKTKSGLSAALWELSPPQPAPPTVARPSETFLEQEASHDGGVGSPPERRPA